MGEGERYAEWALMLFAGCVIGWLWAIRPEALATIDWLQVMTALGTVGAVLTALSADWRRRMEDRRKDVLRAKLLAPLLISRLGGAYLDMKAVITEWGDVGNPFAFRGEKAKAINCVNKVLDHLRIEQIGDIVGGSEACAAHFSQGVARLHMCLSYLEKITEDDALTLDMGPKAKEYFLRAKKEFELAAHACGQWGQWK